LEACQGAPLGAASGASGESPTPRADAAPIGAAAINAAPTDTANNPSRLMRDRRCVAIVFSI
jgi:hypothetical protein